MIIARNQVLRGSNQLRHKQHLTTGSPHAYHGRTEPSASISTKPGDRMNDNIASADLQNPSDALEILAQVADRADDGSSPGSERAQGNNPVKFERPQTQLQEPISSNMDIDIQYRPFTDGLIKSDMIYQLFSTPLSSVQLTICRYERNFHPYFPIILRQTFDPTRIPWLSRTEPHLFSAILTIASRDHESVHQVCYDHMQQLVSMILAGSDANVEAVEALLLLSQWVSHRPQADVAIGRGEEDRVAWMYIGTALRLGYYLGLDRTSFKSESNEDPAIFNRKRLTWTACYICDRQVSVRVGKGFWARGPGPLSGLRSDDFPTLQPSSSNLDNYALIFQANLELTQIFSNVHDILYSSKGHGWKEMLEGRYAKYLDDFRISIRSWNDSWGGLSCSPGLKGSLLLTYDYLRLYVNAFAYQATISRALTLSQVNTPSGGRPTIPQINASAPDARFIYESLDAAKSLLSTFNNYIEPETLRYMPSSYYLFIIYSAVFLYKARSTTTMADEERLAVRSMINQTIERLQKASTGKAHMGSRYARLLQLLWRKAPKRTHAGGDRTQWPGQDPTPYADSSNNNTNANNNSSLLPDDSFPPDAINNNNIAVQQQPPPPPSGNNTNNTFSWLDLDATWNFATKNNGAGMGGIGGAGGGGGGSGASNSGASAGELEDFNIGSGGIGGEHGGIYDLGVLEEYGLLGGGVEGEGFVF
ncbi:C6 transcription factor protein [Rutstroemia sp. NJR-2017a BBW]|nr:C6 transcription factor protein [Rutstroemia sp. NJR-2017a BBW]